MARHICERIDRARAQRSGARTRARLSALETQRKRMIECIRVNKERVATAGVAIRLRARAPSLRD